MKTNIKINFGKEQTMKKPSVLIVGAGVVGKHIKSKFYWADLYDKYDQSMQEVLASAPTTKYDFAFICVPTPSIDDEEGRPANLIYVEDAINSINAGIYILKSTVPPSTTDSLIAKTGKKIVFSPEYNGATQHANVEYGFLILGGDSKITEKVSQLYQYISTAYINIYQVDAKTAELCKYMENCFLATKVTFCNEFYRMAKKLDINYNILRELFCLDPRVNKSHTFVYEDYPYYDSKCFNKDLPAIVAMMKSVGYDADFIDAVIANNEKFKNES